jgi:hypothetical protein
VSDYPLYCSRYNPIEHRLFPHFFEIVDSVKELMEKASTSKGAAGYGGYSGEDVPNWANVCGRVKGRHEDRI